MRISRVRVQHFRSIEDDALEMRHLTSLVGANGGGKSAFLKALDSILPSGRGAVDGR